MERIGRLDWIAKAGFVARGSVYILFGCIALTLRDRADEGQSAVFDVLERAPAGTVLLAATAAGLTAYGLFRLACAALDIEGKGPSLKGWAGRAAQAGSGAIHLALAWSAVQFLIGWKHSFDHAGDARSRAAVRTLLTLPLGDAALYAIAAGLFVAAGLQLRKAWTGSHMKQTRGDAPKLADAIGRIGLVTRAVVFALVGLSFWRSAHSEQPGQVTAVGGAIGGLGAHPLLYMAVCVGVILFGTFSLLLARYRMVPPIDVVATGKAEARRLIA
ncbi:MAG: DUF1206 domain-containing protein [Novosphingobium sp.]|nr:DUF1206 domain-containing protein [Novosphingobium sp.]